MRRSPPLSLLGVVVVHAPTQIARGRLVYRTTHLREISRDMMLEALLTDQSQQLLQPWNPGHACAAKSLQRIVSKLPLPHVSANLAMEVIGREAHVGHRARLDPANASAKGILLTHRA